MEIISQREKYLQGKRARLIDFGRLVVKEYNSGIKAKDIAASHINPQTGKPYSTFRIYAIIRFMRSIE